MPGGRAKVVVAANSARPLLIQLRISMAHHPVIGNTNIRLNCLVRCQDLWLLFAFHILYAVRLSRLIKLHGVVAHLFRAGGIRIVDESAIDLSHII